MAFKAPSKTWQGGRLAPLKKTTFSEIKTILMTSGGGRLVSCHVICVCTPQSSEFLSEVLVNSKGSLPQGQHPANQIQLNSSCGRVGREAFSCVIHREIFGNLPKYIQSRSVLDMKAWSKQNYLNIL
jgi:hypothetical protein